MTVLPDSALAALPAAELDAAVHQAFLALADGRIDNPPRREELSRAGEVQTFRLELTATWLDRRGRPLLTARKVIEETADQDALGQRALGGRTARLELAYLPGGLTVQLDADQLTDRRTGAAAALALGYLADRAEVVALVGTGRVAEQAALAADRLLRPRELRATSRTRERRDAFAARLAGRLAATLRLCEDADQAFAGADTAILAVPASEPILTAARLAGLDHAVAVEGDPRAVLIAPEVLAAGPVVCDDPGQAAASGSFRRARSEGIQPALAQFEGRVATVADAAAGRLDGLKGSSAVTLLTGLAALDLAVGAAVWARAGGPAWPPS